MTDNDNTPRHEPAVTLRCAGKRQNDVGWYTRPTATNAPTISGNWVCFTTASTADESHSTKTDNADE